MPSLLEVLGLKSATASLGDGNEAAGDDDTVAVAPPAGTEPAPEKTTIRSFAPLNPATDSALFCVCHPAGKANRTFRPG